MNNVPLAAALIVAFGLAQAIDSPRERGTLALQTTTATTALGSPESEGQRLLELTNQARVSGATCGDQVFAPAPVLTWNPKLYQAALAHAVRMASANFFAHIDPSDGSGEWERMVRAGYAPSASGENIAAGDSSPEGTVRGWLESPGHCANIMSADFRRRRRASP